MCCHLNYNTWLTVRHPEFRDAHSKTMCILELMEFRIQKLRSTSWNVNSSSLCMEHPMLTWVTSIYSQSSAQVSPPQGRCARTFWTLFWEHRSRKMMDCVSVWCRDVFCLAHARVFWFVFVLPIIKTFLKKMTPKWDSVVVYTLKIKRNYITLVD